MFCIVADGSDARDDGPDPGGPVEVGPCENERTVEAPSLCAVAIPARQARLKIRSDPLVVRLQPPDRSTKMRFVVPMWAANVVVRLLAAAVTVTNQGGG
jgi:hypothetical protein